MQDFAFAGLFRISLGCCNNGSASVFLYLLLKPMKSTVSFELSAQLFGMIAELLASSAQIKLTQRDGFGKFPAFFFNFLPFCPFVKIHARGLV